MKRMDMNLRKCILLVFLFPALMQIVSCTSNTSTPSGYIIPPDSMAIIISEIHYADAVLITAENQRRVRLEHMPEYYSHLLNKMNISKERFDSSLVFYSKDLSLLAEVYDRVIQILQTKQSEIKESR